MISRNNEGSCGIDPDLLDAADLIPNPHVEIYNMSNGQRFTTYLIAAARDSGAVLLNGAAARCAGVGDLPIICAYSMYSEAELESYRPIVVLCDAQNRPHKAHSARSAYSEVA